jgi:hypothetical protein
MADAELFAPGVKAAPLIYDVPGGQEIGLKVASATFDGTGAGASWQPAIQIVGPSGQVLRTFALEPALAAGASADVTFFPSGGVGKAVVTPLPILDFVQFNPVAGFIPISSSNPDVPDLIATGNALGYDGLTEVQILFYAGAMDVDQRGIANTGALIIELWRDAGPEGVICSYNASDQDYAAAPCNLSAFDTPPAGLHTYSVRGYIQPGGGGTQGPTNVYGANVTTPHATRPGYFAILEAKS